jgi:hypothetical protein
VDRDEHGRDAEVEAREAGPGHLLPEPVEDLSRQARLEWKIEAGAASSVMILMIGVEWVG